MQTRSDCEQLCEVGDTLYRVGARTNSIQRIKIVRIEHYPHCVYRDDAGHSYFNRSLSKSCFKTEEDAEAELHRREAIVSKRKLLKEYEVELNKILGLEDHYIIK
jgi:hypothetical protein